MSAARARLQELVEEVDETMVRVRYDDFFDEEDETQHEVEAVKRAQLRAVPAEPPPNWMQSVKVGARLEIHVEEGWWPVRLRQKRVGGKDLYRVESCDYDKTHMVSSKRLRPAPRAGGVAS